MTTGVSAGWRDRYGANLAMQWVDISDVQPGVYRLVAEIDTDDVIQEAGESNNTVAFAAADSIVPRYRALAVNAGTLPAARASTITRSSPAFGSPGAPVPHRDPALGGRPAQRRHGAGGGIRPDGQHPHLHAELRRDGPDTFSYSASDSTSQFPRTPAAASVSLTVGQAPAETRVAISGAPATLDKGTSAQLTATVTNGARRDVVGQRRRRRQRHGRHHQRVGPPPGARRGTAGRDGDHPRDEHRGPVGLR